MVCRRVSGWGEIALGAEWVQTASALSAAIGGCRATGRRWISESNSGHRATVRSNVRILPGVGHWPHSDFVADKTPGWFTLGPAELTRHWRTFAACYEKDHFEETAKERDTVRSLSCFPRA